MDPNLEARLILTDIRTDMANYISLQPDISEQKLKSASLVAQDIDLRRRLGAANLSRCENAQTPSDLGLKALVVPALIFYTYSRALKMFQGVLTDGGWVVESTADMVALAKTSANEHYATAEVYMALVDEYLESENESSLMPIKSAKMPQIRVFGGHETWEN